MSVIDDLRQAQERVVSRLQELEPLVAEYQQLRDEAERMGLSGAQQQAPDDSAPSAQSSRGSRSRSRSSQSGTTRRRAGTSSRAAGSGSGSRRRARAGTSAAETTTSEDSAAAKDTTPATASTSETTRTTSGTSDDTTRRTPGTRAGQASRREDVLRLVAQQPGATVTDIGKQLGVDPTGLYRVVRKLVADGDLRKDGAKLTPAGS